MRRREFITLLGGAVVGWPVAANAQQAAKIARIGYLGQNLAPNPQAREAFRQGLRDLGYVEGRNLVIEYRDAEEKFDRFPARPRTGAEQAGRVGGAPIDSGPRQGFWGVKRYLEV